MKTVALEFGPEQVNLNVPDHTDVLTCPVVVPLPDPAQAIKRVLAEPLGTPALADLAGGRSSAAIVVSDNTRPVPYQGPGGILRPLIETLKAQSVPEIRIIIATGTHREMTDQEMHALFDASAFQPGVTVINHVGTDSDMLGCIGSTGHTPEVTINRHYLDADLKILTGLVEPHLMAGYSGGRKAVCPGISGRSVTYGFHSAAMLDHPDSRSLVLDANPCHQESLRIARMAGVDFIINVTIDSAKRTNGVFAGELEQAHRAAVAHCDTFAAVPIDQRYDVVVTHGGYVGINHYQCCKAAYESARAVLPGGAIVMLAHLCDQHPLGSDDYQRMTAELARRGPADFRTAILSAQWTFTPDQWCPQMWAKAFTQLGDPKLYYTCAPRLAPFDDRQVPETNVAAGCPRRPDESEPAWAQRMLQATVDRLIQQGRADRLLVLPDGPYAVPALR